MYPMCTLDSYPPLHVHRALDGLIRLSGHLTLFARLVIPFYLDSRGVQHAKCFWPVVNWMLCSVTCL